MARVLVERETIYTSEVNMLMKGATYDEVLAYMEEHDKKTPDNPFGSVMPEETSKSENKEEAEKSEEKAEETVEPTETATEEGKESTDDNEN